MMSMFPMISLQILRNRCHICVSPGTCPPNSSHYLDISGIMPAFLAKMHKGRHLPSFVHFIPYQQMFAVKSICVNMYPIPDFQFLRFCVFLRCQPNQLPGVFPKALNHAVI